MLLHRNAISVYMFALYHATFVNSLIYANTLVVEFAYFSVNTVKSYEQCFIFPISTQTIGLIYFTL